jgi:hypothetical protein
MASLSPDERKLIRLMVDAFRPRDSLSAEQIAVRGSVSSNLATSGSRQNELS